MLRLPWTRPEGARPDAAAVGTAGRAGAGVPGNLLPASHRRGVCTHRTGPGCGQQRAARGLRRAATRLPGLDRSQRSRARLQLPAREETPLALPAADSSAAPGTCRFPRAGEGEEAESAWTLCTMRTPLPLCCGDFWLLILYCTCQVPSSPTLWRPAGCLRGPSVSHTVTFPGRCGEPTPGPRTTQVSALLGQKPRKGIRSPRGCHLSLF